MRLRVQRAGAHAWPAFVAGNSADKDADNGTVGESGISAVG